MEETWIRPPTPPGLSSRFPRRERIALPWRRTVSFRLQSANWHLRGGCPMSSKNRTTGEQVLPDPAQFRRAVFHRRDEGSSMDSPPRAEREETNDQEQNRKPHEEEDERGQDAEEDDGENHDRHFGPESDVQGNVGDPGETVEGARRRSLSGTGLFAPNRGRYRSGDCNRREEDGEQDESNARGRQGVPQK